VSTSIPAFSIRAQGFRQLPTLEIGREPAPYYCLVSLQHFAVSPMFLVDFQQYFQACVHGLDGSNKLGGGTVLVKDLDEK
jgi:hypothetical protein